MNATDKAKPKTRIPKPQAVAVHCAHDALVPLADLRPNPKNPNRHPDSQLDLLGKLIAHHGWRAPVVVSKRSGFIAAGHGRVEAAGKLGLSVAPVNFQDFASEADELAFLVADNRIPELAEMDDAALVRLIEEDLRGEIDLELAGILEELEEAELKAVEVQPPPAMAWVLIGIPTVRFGEINAEVERIAALPGAMVETTVTNA